MKRFLPFLIIAAVALLTVGLATAVYRTKTGDQPTSPRPTSDQPAPVAGIGVSPAPSEAPEDSNFHARGPRKAPVTLVVYGDFQCPSCAAVSQGVDELQKQYEGKMRVIFHEFPLEMHRHAVEAAMAAEAAGLQGKFWEMHDMLYKNQTVWGEATSAGFLFESYAVAIGLDVERFKADRVADNVRARVVADAAEGAARGVKVTPTIFINGVALKAGFTKDKLKETIEAALAPKKGS